MPGTCLAFLIACMLAAQRSGSTPLRGDLSRSSMTLMNSSSSRTMLVVSMVPCGVVKKYFLLCGSAIALLPFLLERADLNWLTVAFDREGHHFRGVARRP